MPNLALLVLGMREKGKLTLREPQSHKGTHQLIPEMTPCGRYFYVPVTARETGTLRGEVICFLL